LSQRSQNSLKVSQPLSEIRIASPTELSDDMKEIILEEVNVKSLIYKKSSKESVELELKLTQDLLDEGVAREIIRRVQSLRKESGLEVDDRIDLVLASDDSNINRAIEKFADEIQKETLASTLKREKSNHTNSIDVDLQKSKLHLSLKRA